MSKLKKLKYKILVFRSHLIWQLKYLPKRIRKWWDFIYFWLAAKKVAQNLHGTIIFLPTIDWQMPLFQRPQHLAQQLAELDLHVFYTTINHEQDDVHGFQKKSTHLTLTNQYKHLMHYSRANWFFILAGQPLIKLKDLQKLKARGNKIIYDYADEIHDDISGSGKATNAVTQRHRAIKESQLADLVLCSAQKLYEEMSKFYPPEKIVLCPNGVDYENFVALQNKPTPADLKPILAQKKPIVGYYGALANWIDYDYLNELLRQRPDYQLVLIGIDYDGTLHKKLDFNQSNLNYLGIKNYTDLPSYAKHFDVALVPFVRGEIAKSTSPLKFFEYMALELPTVVTKDLVECTKYPTTLVAENKNDFVFKIDQGISLKNKAAAKAKYRQIAKDNTWQKRAQAIYNLI